MPEFAYHAVDRSGTPIHGVMFADNESILEDNLQDIGYWLIDVKISTKRIKREKGSASRRELIDFFNGMSALLTAGVTAADTFKAMVDETENEIFKHVLEDIEVNVQAGNSIYDAMSKHVGVFSEQVCNLIHAGEYSGNLAATFHDLSTHLEWVDRLMSDVKQASIYPIMILLAVGGLIGLLLSFVVPKFTAIFEDVGLDMPLMTRIVISLGDYWWLMVMFLTVIIVVLKISIKFFPQVERLVDHLKFNIPVFGPINRMLVMSRFVHNLSLMVRSGVPILDALGLCRKLVDSSIMGQAIQDAELAVNEGKKMSDALRNHDIISPLVLRMIVVGEETGKLDESLKHVSSRFDDEIPRRIKRAFGVMEPVIILVLISVVGLVAAAVFLPMFSLMSGLGK